MKVGHDYTPLYMHTSTTISISNYERKEHNFHLQKESFLVLTIWWIDKYRQIIQSWQGEFVQHTYIHIRYPNHPPPFIIIWSYPYMWKSEWLLGTIKTCMIIPRPKVIKIVPYLTLSTTTKIFAHSFP